MMTNKEARIAAAKEMEGNGNWRAASIVWQELAFEFRDPDLVNLAAMAAWEAGLVKRAEELFLEALKIQPANANALFGLGMLLEELNRLAEARSFLEAGLQVEERAPVLTILGSVVRRLGDNDTAQMWYRRSLAVSPDDAEAHHGLGLTLISRRPLEAAEQFRLALDIDPNLFHSRREMGHALWKAGRYEEAERACREAIVQNENDSWAHDYLGHLLLINGDSEGAEKEFRGAIELAPDQAFFHCNLGDLLARRGRLVEAEQAYLNALAADTGSSLANLKYGQILKSKGRLTTARKYLERALNADPTDPRPRAALDEIDRDSSSSPRSTDIDV